MYRKRLLNHLAYQLNSNAFWVLAKRENDKCHPYRPLTHIEEAEFKRMPEAFRLYFSHISLFKLLIL